MQYVTVLHHDEAYLFCILLDYFIYQGVRAEEELSISLHFADTGWMRDLGWFIWEAAKNSTSAEDTLSALNYTSGCLYFSFFVSDEKLQILESDYLCVCPGPAATCHISV